MKNISNGTDNVTSVAPVTAHFVNPFVNGTSNNAEWVGLDKTNHLSYYLRVSLLFIPK